MRNLTITLLFTALVSCQDSAFKGYTGGGSSKDTRRDTGTPQTVPGTNIPSGNSTITPNQRGQGIDLSFGKLGTTWHIGDNNYDSTACKLKITFKSIKGQHFTFNFYVERDGTELGITLSHCGIDDHFANMHRVSLLGPTASASTYGAELSSLVLPASENFLFMKKQQFPQRMVLNRGWYKIRVATSMNPANNDLDDFVVGNVKILTPSGPVTLGEVTSN